MSLSRSLLRTLLFANVRELRSSSFSLPVSVAFRFHVVRSAFATISFNLVRLSRAVPSNSLTDEREFIRHLSNQLQESGADEMLHVYFRSSLATFAAFSVCLFWFWFGSRFVFISSKCRPASSLISANVVSCFQNYVSVQATSAFFFLLLYYYGFVVEPVGTVSGNRVECWDSSALRLDKRDRAIKHSIMKDKKFFLVVISN